MKKTLLTFLVFFPLSQLLGTLESTQIDHATQLNGPTASVTVVRNLLTPTAYMISPFVSPLGSRFITGLEIPALINLLGPLGSKFKGFLGPLVGAAGVLAIWSKIESIISAPFKAEINAVKTYGETKVKRFEEGLMQLINAYKKNNDDMHKRGKELQGKVQALGNRVPAFKTTMEKLLVKEHKQFTTALSRNRKNGYYDQYSRRIEKVAEWLKSNEVNREFHYDRKQAQVLFEALKTTLTDLFNEQHREVYETSY